MSTTRRRTTAGAVREPERPTAATTADREVFVRDSAERLLTRYARLFERLAEI